VGLGKNADVTQVAIIGGGPGGYEAALVARQLGADVTLISGGGIGGSCVLTDCVPSKALIATADTMTRTAESAALGILVEGHAPTQQDLRVDLAAVNARITELAAKQSGDIAERLAEHGVNVRYGTGRLHGLGTVHVTHDGGTDILEPDLILIATGARPRVLFDAQPDGIRILTWEQLYTLSEIPERLIVVGSGVTGAEFASAYRGLGSEVVLVSSRDRVLPGEDPDAAEVVEHVFRRRGIEVRKNSRAVTAQCIDAGVDVTLEDGSVVHGSHVLLAVGSVPNTENLGLADAGVRVDQSGFIEVDRVSRTSVRNIYAAGDCTGVLMLASVAAMQGRIAMWHALGDAVAPLDVATVSSTVFTNPEIAAVGVTEGELQDGRVRGDVHTLPLATNARAKMIEDTDGFVKIICRRGTRTVAGGVIVGPHASELIHAMTIAVEQRMTVDELASVFTVYPSLSGSIAETARQLRVAAD
jgi:NAD(P)H dehydrogenase (quinone)